MGLGLRWPRVFTLMSWQSPSGGQPGTVSGGITAGHVGAGGGGAR